MIPEFITAKPTTNRNASETPSVAAEHSADRLLNKDAFQKALQEQTSEGQSEQQTSRSGDRRQIPAADESRPESTSRLTPDRTAADTDGSNSLREPSTAAANQPPASGNDAESSATDAERADDSSVNSQKSTGGAEESQREPRESSKLIRRIDPATHQLRTMPRRRRPTGQWATNWRVRLLTLRFLVLCHRTIWTSRLCHR